MPDFKPEEIFDPYPDDYDGLRIPESVAVRAFNGLMETAFRTAEEVQAYLSDPFRRREFRWRLSARLGIREEDL